MDTKISENSKFTLDDIAQEYGKLVSSVCRRMITDEDIARDAAQQVWVEIVKSFPSFRGESKISTWIYTITRRIATELARNERIITTRFLNVYSFKEEFEFPVDLTIDKKIWIKQMCDKCITGILHCVDNESRLMHILRDIADLGYDEISDIMGNNPTVVRQIVTRSRKKVNAFLNNKCTLYNPDGECRCRMRRWVSEINLASEYQKIKTITSRVNFYKKSEMVLPRKNYWINLL
jgi:RNA polymerase sigma-70 factor (ECF subfamily)